MNNTERQPGYYRVKCDGEWEFMWWNERKWLCFLGYRYLDDDLDEIDETPINPIPEDKR